MLVRNRISSVTTDHCASNSLAARCELWSENGEYRQIHVRMGIDGNSHVTIFKNGRNSAMDRKRLLPTIETCLGVDTTDCRIQRQCVLVGAPDVKCYTKNPIEFRIHHSIAIPSSS